MVKGSYSARNKGIQVSKGEILAFTDSDCIPDPNWLEKGVFHLTTNTECGMVGGNIEVVCKDPSRPTTIELFQCITGFPQKKFLVRYHGCATANLFAKRKIFNNVGLFDSRLKSFGDIEWGQRVYRAGYKQVYADDALVYHPCRYSWHQLKQQTVRVSGGIYDCLVGQQQSWVAKQTMFVRILLDDLIRPFKFTINTFRSKQLKGVNDKLRVSTTRFGVAYVSAVEKVRLNFGGVSRRQ